MSLLKKAQRAVDNAREGGYFDHATVEQARERARALLDGFGDYGLTAAVAMDWASKPSADPTRVPGTFSRPRVKVKLTRGGRRKLRQARLRSAA